MTVISVNFQSTKINFQSTNFQSNYLANCFFTPTTAERLTDIPIWAFHGEKGSVVPASKSTAMVAAIKKLGGEKAKMAVYPGVNHNSWSQTYANKEVYEWLLSHRLKLSKPKK